MSDLPNRWIARDLGEVVEILDYLRVPVNSDERNKRLGNVPYFGATGQVGWIDDYLFDEELVLIGEDGAPFFDKSKQIAYIINGKSWVNNHAHVLRAINGITSNLFIKYFLDQYDFHEYVNGTTRLKLTQGAMKTIPVLLPPLNEQKRILENLEKLFAKTRAAQDRLDKIPIILKRFRQAILAAACSGKLTADWRRENDVDIQTWSDAILKNVADLRLGKMLDKAKNTGIPTPYLRNINVRWFGFDLEDLGLIKVTEKDKQELSIKNGDLLICEGGEPGRCAVWNKSKTNIVFQKALHRIRLNRDISPYWLAILLKHSADTGELEEYFTGTTIKHLTGKSLANFRFLSPLYEEQKEIVRRVEELFKFADQIESRYKKARSYTDKLTQSILAKAFRGELVPQDPNDEPASLLLERIAKDRAANGSSNIGLKSKKKKAGG